MILNDCRYTNQCGGIACKSCVPFLENANSNTNGKGRSMAKAGRGGSLLKSEKNPL